MLMKTDLDAVIRAVAVNNGAGLKKTDAVMQLVTVMDAIIESHTQQLAEQQKALLVGFAEKIEASLLRANTDMKANTEHSVHAVTEYAKDNRTVYGALRICSAVVIVFAVIAYIRTGRFFYLPAVATLYAVAFYMFPKLWRTPRQDGKP